MKQCLFCNTEFQEQRSTAKFCSTLCRVKWNKKQPPKNVVTKTQMQVLYNSMLNIVENMNRYQGGIAAAIVGNAANSISNQKSVQTSEQKEVPNLGLFDGYKAELGKCKVIPEIQEVLKRIENSQSLPVMKKVLLKNYAKELSKEMYSD